MWQIFMYILFAIAILIGLVVAIVLAIAFGVVAFVVCGLLFVFICGLFVNKDKEYEKPSKFYTWLFQFSTVSMMILFNVRIRAEGLEKVPQGRFLLVSNHRSNYDPILTSRVFRKHQLAWISKPSNFKVPFFGPIIQRLCYMPIDRENARNAVKTINRASKYITDDTGCVGVYPEGTRSKKCTLLPFHNSVFKVAQKAKVPVVVMAICGTELIHKRVPFKRTVVTVKVIDVISQDEVLSMRTSEMGERMKLRLEEELPLIEGGRETKSVETAEVSEGETEQITEQNTAQAEEEIR